MTEGAQSIETAGTWRIAATVDWRAWDGEIVAYNGRSGDTHHFADFAGWLFVRLVTTPTDIRSLTTAATEALELRSGVPELTVERTLALFQKLDLLEQVA